MGLSTVIGSGRGQIGMDNVGFGLPAALRMKLAEKGRLLYAKSCGMVGKRTCAESFALFHIGRGKPQVALDLLAFLENEAETLKLDDPNRRLVQTEELIASIRRHLEKRCQEPLIDRF
jgi:hypothetical protein